MKIAGEEATHAATVPGSVYADLLADGSMPDPFYRDNELGAFRLMEHDFIYRRTFALAEEDITKQHIVLRCDGLDTLAHVTVNGTAVGDADNMHIRWEWDVKRLLRFGENEIEIRLDSPVNFALKAAETMPLWGSDDATPGYPHLRKAHCMFGWDWGPRLPDAGIWRSIGLLAYDGARLTDVHIRQTHAHGVVTLRITPAIEGAGCRYRVQITAPDGSVTDGGTFDGGDTAQLVIDHPQLWWPSGYGGQPLYTVTVTLLHGEETLDAWPRRIGLRTLTVSRDQDAWGEEFCHVVNGVKVFAMGADYIPEDNILRRVTPARTRRLLEDAKLAHFNCIRVWGGGYYPDDAFYDLCDELGLLVWQDFMFACSAYHLTPAFERSIRNEAVQNVRRIRHHACLALLCGNNENEMFMADTMHAADNPITPEQRADYVKMFEYILPQVCRAEAPDTFYWPSSPSSGGAFDGPNDENRGDVHYWDVWHGNQPFQAFRRYHFRYASEFGFQSFPCLATVESFTRPADRNLSARIMEHHQRNRTANGKIINYLIDTYQVPLTFDDLLYCSQLLQADAIRCGVEHFRRHRGRCMGTIYWQLNDCWPVASWASVDYYGRWKALHYAAKRFFAPVMISAQEEGEHTQHPMVNTFRREPVRCSVRLNVANEQRTQVRGVVRWALRDAQGAVLREGKQPLTVAPLSAVWLEPVALADASATEHYISYSFAVDGTAVSEGCALLCAPKHFAFADPGLAVSAADGWITVHADAFAKSVYIQSDDPDLLLSDNFFDMNPGEKRVQILRGNAEQVRVRSVYSIQTL